MSSGIIDHKKQENEGL